MMQSEKIDQLAAALSKVQSALSPAIKDSKANYGKYADLTSVWDACRKPLSDNGLSVAQGFGRDDKDGYVWTTLMHSSGQWVSGECPLILGKRDPQGVGAAMTYYRRYSLAAILGITQDDDDAQSAMPKHKSIEAPAPMPSPAPANAKEATADEFHAATEAAAKLHQARDIEELRIAWTLVPANLRPSLESLKNQIKDSFLKEGK